jgi:acyl-CoA synthetase (AMP-forming)/AMP-acid ligase II
MRCPALMNGYHNLPEVTAKALTADGFYITGDVFRRDMEGFYYFIGRADDMFVSGGENIYPGEVEAMLERHPDIHQAIVVPVDDELKFKKPVAFVVTRPGAAPSEEAVQQFALAMPRPICIRAGYGSCRKCHSPAPTRSTGTRSQGARQNCC